LHQFFKVNETTKDADIICRRWLSVDIDPKRPEGVSATEDEKRAARDQMLKVKEGPARKGVALTRDRAIG
jgi:hypothetical protein